MKYSFRLWPRIKCLRNILATVIGSGLLMGSASLYAQTDTTAKTIDTVQKETPATDDGASLIAPAMEFLSVQKGDSTIDLKATLKAKVKGILYKLPLLKVTFILVTDTAEKRLGFVITDREGKAIFNAGADELVPDKEGKLHFKAVFAGNKAMDAAEEEITIKRGRLEIIKTGADSLHTFGITLTDIGTGTETPVSQAVVGLFVKRMFYPLKIGEGTTDDNGEVSVEVPSGLPGDEKGNLTFLARLDENETYGNLEASVIQKWGTPVSNKSKDLPRALWSSHPPIWMLITFIVLMTAVWGHYIIIIFELFRLRKEEPRSPVDTTIS